MISDRVSSPSRPWLGHGLAWVAGLCALGAASVAQARDLNWSIGIDSPGVSVGVSNHRPVVVYPQPVYVQPRPYYRAGWGHGPRWDDRHDRRHWKHRHHDRYDRHGRGDDRWDDDDRGRGHGRYKDRD